MPDATPPLPNVSDTGLPSNVAAGICAIFHLLGGLVFYFIEKKDQFVRHWAIQTIYFGGAWIAAFFAIGFLSLIFTHAPLVGWIFVLLFALLHFAVWLGGVVLWIIGVVKAFQGQKWEYPITSELGKKIFPNLS
jgi:uncharacterized membrane protein